MSDQSDNGIADLVISVLAVLGTAVAIPLLVGPNAPLLLAFVVFVVLLGVTLGLTLAVEFRYSPTG
jgi:uncharacterized membrane protein